MGLEVRSGIQIEEEERSIVFGQEPKEEGNNLGRDLAWRTRVGKALGHHLHDN